MKTKNLRILNWLARIWSIVSIAFILIFFLGSLLGPDKGGENDPSILMFVFFPIGLLIGLILAWKWKFTGGLIAVLSIILFHLTIEPEFNLFIELLAFPGLLFLILGVISKKVS
jgi:hypothetical protein